MHATSMRQTPDSVNSADGPTHPSLDDPGLACLVIIARFHGIPVDAQQLKHQVGPGALDSCFSHNQLLLAAKLLGLKAKAVQLEALRLIKTPLPALMIDRDNRHFILARVSDDANALIQEGYATGPSILSHMR